MILVTGGAGYIGAHICLELLGAGHAVAVLDNLCNSSAESLRRVEALSGRSIVFVKADLRDRAAIDTLLAAYPISAVIHCAGLKSVGESADDPLAYYDVNVGGTAQLLAAMAARGIKRIVFGSSATIYGTPQSVPIVEDHPDRPANPYGRTKLVVEQMLADLQRADGAWRVGILRYFNPAGAHASGRIGEDPNGTPNNLMPFIAQVAAGRRAHLTVFGDNYPTPDGTGIRDYVHVVDLAQAHLRALERLESGRSFTVNLGTGRGYSVMEIIRAFEQASGRTIPYVVGPPRAGDVASCYADPTAASRALGWQAIHGLAEMCADHWRWQSHNPDGYGLRRD